MDNNRTILIVAVVAFIVGLIIGYGMSGDGKEEKADVKQVLAGVIQDIETMEQENKDLTDDLKKAKNSKANRENKELKEKISQIEKEKENLQEELNKLGGKVAHTELQLEAKDELKAVIENLQARIEGLEMENRDLKVVIDAVNSITMQHDIEAPDRPGETPPEQATEAAPEQAPEEGTEPEAAPAGTEGH